MLTGDSGIITQAQRSKMMTELSGYKEELEKKLIEECKEVLAAKGNDRIMELADLLEVMTSLAELENKTLDDINFVREQKKNERGGFSKKLFLKDVK